MHIRDRLLDNLLTLLSPPAVSPHLLAAPRALDWVLHVKLGLLGGHRAHSGVWLLYLDLRLQLQPPQAGLSSQPRPEAPEEVADRYVHTSGFSNYLPICMLMKMFFIVF